MPVSTLCVGVDVHLNELVLRAVDKTDGHEVLKRFRVTNNLPGSQAVITTLTDTAQRLGYAHLEMGWEATGLLWLPFHQQLVHSPALQSLAPKLICFNPKLVANFKDGLVLRHPKNDERDAWDVAARVRIGELPVSYVPNDFWQGVRRLTRYRYHLARDLQREQLRFQANAFLKCSDWQRVKPFADPFGATSLALLSEFTAADLKAMSPVELVDLITRRGHNSFADPAATARAVREALSSSYPIDPQLDALLTTTLAVSAEHLRMLRRLIQRLDQQIAHAIALVPNPLLTVKGLGPVITAGLLAEIVDTHAVQCSRHALPGPSATGSIQRSDLGAARHGAVRFAGYSLDQSRQRLSALLHHSWSRSFAPARLGLPSLLLAQISGSAETSTQTRSRLDRPETHPSDPCPAHEERAVYREASDADSTRGGSLAISPNRTRSRILFHGCRKKPFRLVCSMIPRASGVALFLPILVSKSFLTFYRMSG